MTDTLTARLASHGLTHRPTKDDELTPAGRRHRHDIMRGDTVVAWSKTAAETWAWLRDEAMICPHCNAIGADSHLGEHLDEDWGEVVDWYECGACSLAWAPEREDENRAAAHGVTPDREVAGG